MHDADKIERGIAVFCKHVKWFADRNGELIGSASSPLTQNPDGLFQAVHRAGRRAPYCGPSFLDRFDWWLATSIASLRTAS